MTVRLEDVIPLVSWTPPWEGATPAEWRINSHARTSMSKDDVDLVCIVAVRDAYYNPAEPEKFGNYPTTDAEAMVKAKASYPTLTEALEPVRAVARLLMLHEVDETLLFGGERRWDPHTKERERLWPGTEENP